MPIMSVYYFVQSLREFFGPFWLCHLWQIADIAVSTISLYSICAIALDRFWNLEKPLRVFKRSRRIAQRLIIAIWIIPLIIWTGVYYFFNLETYAVETANSRPTRVTGRCYTKWSHNYVPILIAGPVVYVPVIILVGFPCICCC
ncbi:unnamed protein product [Enterobius vermicularis]|uniref:G_PROTEIN_RECEP_F1_2 domain-containing protein n=1 Tax=Enterobius vermicularis TaxID=51028 RepID=A0A0N4VCE7_ENTVE|nr:unnamed protein product [Enterobius vermicularis]